MPRRLGQHFLKDKRALREITAALEINSRDVVVEIGPGHGELTKHLLARKPKKLIAIEKDPQLVKFLNQELKVQKSKLKIIEGDILKLLNSGIDSKLKIRNSKLAGNIPYYITGHLLRKISELEKKPKLIVFTIQKEVAERIIARPPRMNLLAASVQFWGKPEIVEYISKKSFRPQPKVDSAIIKIAPSPLTRYSVSKGMGLKRAVRATEHYKFIRILFKQPRKTTLNNLRQGLKLPSEKIEKPLKELKISPQSRPADLSLEDINKLARIFRKRGYN